VQQLETLPTCLCWPFTDVFLIHSGQARSRRPSPSPFAATAPVSSIVAPRRARPVVMQPSAQPPADAPPPPPRAVAPPGWVIGSSLSSDPSRPIIPLWRPTEMRRGTRSPQPPLPPPAWPGPHARAAVARGSLFRPGVASTLIAEAAAAVAAAAATGAGAAAAEAASGRPSRGWVSGGCGRSADDGSAGDDAHGRVRPHRPAAASVDDAVGHASPLAAQHRHGDGSGGDGGSGDGRDGGSGNGRGSDNDAGSRRCQPLAGPDSRATRQTSRKTSRIRRAGAASPPMQPPARADGARTLPASRAPKPATGGQSITSSYIWDTTTDVALRTAIAAVGWGEWAAIARAMAAAVTRRFTARAVEARARKLLATGEAALVEAQAADKRLGDRRIRRHIQAGIEAPPSPSVPLRGPGNTRKRSRAEGGGGVSVSGSGLSAGGRGLSQGGGGL